jgi:hypothetical protein
MRYFQVAEFEAGEDDDFLGCCSSKLLPLLRAKGRDARVDLGWIKLRNTISGEINVALFVDSNVPHHLAQETPIHSEASDENHHEPLQRQNSLLSTDLLTRDDVEDTIDEHGGWREDGKFFFGVHVISGRNM